MVLGRSTVVLGRSTMVLGRSTNVYPGHQAHSDLVMLPIEEVSSKDPFLLRARETFTTVGFKTEKRLGVTEPEHGLNLDKGQV